MEVDELSVAGPPQLHTPAKKRPLPPLARPASLTRWPMLGLGVLILLGPYYAFDNPAATEVSLRIWFRTPEFINENSTIAMNASYSDFNQRYQLTYALYSLPNTVLPLFSGVLVDTIGVRTMVVATTVGALLGQAVVAAGVATGNWDAILAGRAIFGIGTEAMCVAQRILVANWFVGKELAAAMGTILAFGRLGSVINDNVSALFPASAVTWAYVTGAAMCAMSVLASVAAVALDAWWEHAYNTAHRLHTEYCVCDAADEEEAAGLIGGFGAGGGRVDLSSSVNQEPRHSRAEDPPTSPTDNECGAKPAAAQPTRDSLLTCLHACCPDLRQLRSLPPGYWLLLAVCLLGFTPVTVFNGTATEFLHQRWFAARYGDETNNMSVINSTVGVLYIVAAATAPLLGGLADCLRRRALFILLAQLLVAVCHVLLAARSDSALEDGALMGLIGAGFAAFASSLWTSVKLLSTPESAGLAFGLMGAVQNVGLTLSPMAVAALQPPACGSTYACVEWLFAGCAAAAAAFAVALVVVESFSAPSALLLPTLEAADLLVDAGGGGGKPSVLVRDGGCNGEEAATEDDCCTPRMESPDGPGADTLSLLVRA